MVAPNTKVDDDNNDKRLYQQVVRVHAAVFERLTQQIWKDLPIIDEVERDAAFLGTLTALLHQALVQRALWDAMDDKRELMDWDDDRDSFLELAGDCWDDFNREFEDDK